MNWHRLFLKYSDFGGCRRLSSLIQTWGQLLKTLERSTFIAEIDITATGIISSDDRSCRKLRKPKSVRHLTNSPVPPVFHGSYVKEN